MVDRRLPILLVSIILLLPLGLAEVTSIELSDDVIKSGDALGLNLSTDSDTQDTYVVLDRTGEGFYNESVDFVRSKNLSESVEGDDFTFSSENTSELEEGAYNIYGFQDDLLEDGRDISTETSQSFEVNNTPNITDFQILNPELNVTFESDVELSNIVVEIEYTDFETESTSSLEMTGTNFTYSNDTYTGSINRTVDANYTATLLQAEDGEGYDGAAEQEDTVIFPPIEIIPEQPIGTVENNIPDIAAFLQDAYYFNEDTLNIQINDSNGVFFEGGADSQEVELVTLTENPPEYDLIIEPYGPGEGLATGDVDVRIDAADGLGDPVYTEWSFEVDPIIQSFKAEENQNDNVNITLESSEELSDITVEVSGQENSLLDEEDITTEDSSAPYKYTGVFEPGDAGEYTFTLESAVTENGSEGANSQYDTFFLTTPPSFSNAEPNATAVNSDQHEISVDITDEDGVDEGTINVNVEDSTGVLLNGGTDEPGVSYNDGNLKINPSEAGFSYEDGNVDVNVVASDTEGNTASTDWSFEVDTVPPVITGYEVVAVSDSDIEILFTSDQELENIIVDIQGPEDTEIDESDFSSTEDSGGFDYTGTFRPGSSGEYEFYLTTAEDLAGNDGAENQLDWVEVDAPPRIDRFELTEVDQEVNLTIESTKDLNVIELDLGGDISESLTRSDFSQTGSDPYVYETTVSEGVDGYFNATLNTAEDSAGQDGAEGETAELNTEAPQNPVSSSLPEDITADNEENVGITVELSQAPETGNLTVRATSSEGDELTEVFSADTGSEEQEVSLDLSSLPDSDIYVEAMIENEFGYSNPEGFTAESSTVLKNTEAPYVSKAITGDSLNGGSTARDKIAIEYNEIGEIDPFTVTTNTFEVQNVTTPMPIEDFSIEDNYFLLDLEEDIPTDMSPTVIVNEGWMDQSGNTQDSSVFFSADNGLSPELEVAVVDSERSDNEQTVVRLEFSEYIFAGEDLGIEGEADSMERDENVVYIGYPGVLETGSSPQVTGVVSAMDNEGNPAAGEQNVKSLVKTFEEGWNSFSVPVETDEAYDIKELTNTSKINSVWRYEDGGWSVYDPEAPENDFTVFEPGEGYMIDVSESHEQGMNVVTTSGSVSVNKDITEGWNLVAHMKEYSMTKEESFSSLESVEDVKALTPGTRDYTEPVQTVPGDAYWVNSTSEDSLTGSFTRSPSSLEMFRDIGTGFKSVLTGFVEGLR